MLSAEVRNRRTITTIQFSVFLNFLGLAMPIPVLTAYFMNLPVDIVHLLNNKTMLFMCLLVYPLGEVLATPIIGNLSDLFGRRRLMMFCLVGSISTFILTGLALQYQNFAWTIVMRFLGGIFEGNSCIAYSSVADVSEPSNRTVMLGKVNAALTLGYVIGPLLGGIFSSQHYGEQFNYAIPFYLSAILHGIALASVYYYLPETHYLKVKNETKEKFLNTLLKLKGKSILARLIVISFIFTLGIDTLYQYLPIYTAFRLKINPLQIGLVISIVSFSKIIGNTIVVRKMAVYYSELQCILVGTFFCVISLCALLISRTLYQTYIILPFIGISIALIVTNMLALITKNSHSAELGKTISRTLGLRVFGSMLIFLFYTILASFLPSMLSIPIIFTIGLIFSGAILLLGNQRI